MTTTKHPKVHVSHADTTVLEAAPAPAPSATPSPAPAPAPNPAAGTVALKRIRPVTPIYWHPRAGSIVPRGGERDGTGGYGGGGEGVGATAASALV
jgi:hypothetical protein